jgi:hypothetical protein
MPCPQRGRKRESSSESGRKQGNDAARGECGPRISFAKCFGLAATGVSQTDRCYEPARDRFVVAAIPESGATIRNASGGFYHEFVIGGF